MFSKLREVLLTQYIGAFLIALLVWQALIETISQLIRSGYWIYYSNRSSALGEYSRQRYRWDNLVYSIVSIILYLLVAYAVGKWLYEQRVSPPVADAEDLPPSHPGEAQ
jgi:hypothetical protein